MLIKMSKLRIILVLIVAVLHIQKSFGDNEPAPGGQKLIWKEFNELPPPPGEIKQHGLAGAFSGVVGNHLIVAGGANFPDALPWNGGEKKWWDHVYVRLLNAKETKWQVYAHKLPRPLAYGVSISLPEGLLCIGGSDAEKVYPDVFLMKYENSTIQFETWPSLPVPLTNMAGALIDGKIYIAGGQQNMEKPAATRHFFVLDIGNKENGWKKLAPWPGPPRAFAVAAGQSNGFDNCFYLFSGRNFGSDVPLTILKDGYEYNPRKNSWKKLDTPASPDFPVMAGTAIASGANHIIFFGGANGKRLTKEYRLRQKINELRTGQAAKDHEDKVRKIQRQIKDLLENHPGFSKKVRLYHTITNTLIDFNTAPFDIPVTTNVVKANNKYLITSGEVRPGVRTPHVLSAEMKIAERSFGLANTIVTFLYFGILVLMGWHFSKRQKSSDDYFRAGGRLPWWAVGLSIFGTALSAITFMAIPAKAYATDWSYIIMNTGIIFVAPLIILLFIPFYRQLDITTAYEYLEKRFNLATRLITSISFILFQIGRMGIVLLLPSIALNVVTGIDIFLCIALMGILSLVYTMMGGIEAVVWTDALQVVILMGGAIYAVVYIILNIQGGVSALLTEGAASNKFDMASTAMNLKDPTLWTVLFATLFANITTYGTDQTMVQRYLTTSDKKTAAKSVWTNAVLTIPATLIFFFVGTALFVFYKMKPELLSPSIAEGDAIFPWFIYTQMPAGFAGLLISGIFAAAMSTLSSSMNSAATAYSIDIHFRFGWSKKKDRLWLARIFTLIIGATGILFAILMATWDIKSLWDEFQRILGLALGGLGGLFLLGLLTRRANGVGAVLGILGSILVQLWVMYTQPVHLLLYAGTGFVACFVIGYIGSLIFPAYDKDVGHLTIYGRKK